MMTEEPPKSPAGSTRIKDAYRVALQNVGERDKNLREAIRETMSELGYAAEQGVDRDDWEKFVPGYLDWAEDLFDKAAQELARSQADTEELRFELAMLIDLVETGFSSDRGVYAAGEAALDRDDTLRGRQAWLEDSRYMADIRGLHGHWASFAPKGLQHTVTVDAECMERLYRAIDGRLNKRVSLWLYPSLQVSSEGPAGGSTAPDTHNVPVRMKGRTGQPRVRRREDQTEVTIQLVKQMRAEEYSAKAMCQRLGDYPRPSHAAWRDLTWPVAYLRHTSSVKKWLSAACK